MKQEGYAHSDWHSIIETTEDLLPQTRDERDTKEDDHTATILTADSMHEGKPYASIRPH